MKQEAIKNHTFLCMTDGIGQNYLRFYNQTTNKFIDRRDFIFQFKHLNLNTIYIQSVFLDKALRKKGVIQKALLYLSLQFPQTKYFSLEVTSTSKYYWKKLGFKKHQGNIYYLEVSVFKKEHEQRELLFSECNEEKL